MSYEEVQQWHGQPAWVIYFQQRKDKPKRTLVFFAHGGKFRATLKGRAWLSVENTEVLHIETNLMQDIPEIGLRNCAVSVEYAPVELSSKKLHVWLPQSIRTYIEFTNSRIILFHAFSSFQLFSVQTKETIQAPKDQQASEHPKVNSAHQRHSSVNV